MKYELKVLHANQGNTRVRKDGRRQRIEMKVQKTITDYCLGKTSLEDFLIRISSVHKLHAIKLSHYVDEDVEQV